MPEQTIEVMVEAGKATAGPPIGSTLGPLGINIAKVVEEINEKTKELEGMKVPVKVIVDTTTKQFKIEIGKPPLTALIKKELKIEKGSAFPGRDRVGDLAEEQVKKIAKAKFGFDADSYINQVRGTCLSMGITIGKGEVTEEELRKEEEEKERIKEGIGEREKVTEEIEGVVEKEEKPEEKIEIVKEEKVKEKKKRKIRKGK